MDEINTVCGVYSTRRIIGIKREFFGTPHIFLNRKTSLNSDIIRNFKKPLKDDGN